MSDFRERFEAANRLVRAGSLAEAEAAYLVLLEERPRSAALLCRLGSLRARADDRDAALGCFERARAIDPALPWAHVGVAEVLEARGDVEGAIAALEQVAPEAGLAWLPGRLDSLRQRAAKRKAATRSRAAEFRERFAAANARLAAGDAAGAEALFRALLSGNPSSASLMCKLADALLRQGQRDEAHGLLSRAQRAEPGFVWPYVGLADLHEAEGRPALALAALEIAQALPGAPPTFGPRIEALRLRARLLPPARVLVADGTEDELQGRALMLVSALHLAAPRLGRTRVHLVGVASDAVRAAAEALAWDTGLEVTGLEEDPAGAPDPAEVLRDASAYAAVAFRGTEHIAPYRQEAGRRGLPEIVAVQLPDLRESAAVLAMARAAHDPQRLADEIVRVLEA